MYQTCAGDADAFTLDGAYDPGAKQASDVDVTCSNDFIGIEGLQLFVIFKRLFQYAVYTFRGDVSVLSVDRGQNATKVLREHLRLRT